jgi:signal transduction histidine kinase
MNRLPLGPSIVAAGTLLALVLFFASARRNVDEMRILRDESARIQHTLDVQRDLDAVLIAVTEADASVRAYLLTGSETMLAGFRTAREAISTRVNRLDSLTVDTPAQRDRFAKLKSAVTSRIERLSAVVASRKKGGVPAGEAEEDTRSAARNDARDHVRTLIAEMEIAETQALAERRDQASRAYQRAVNGRVGAGFISAALLIGIALIAGFHARTKARRESVLVQSERRAREAAAREQEARAEAERANREKDQFLAVLSHELRTPLNAVLGWTQILQTAGPSESTIVRALASIRRNAETQQRLVEDLLDVSRIITGKLPFEREPFNLRVAVSAAVESIRPAVEAKGLTLTSHLDNTRPVMGDAGRIQQVAGNLLSNAVKFTQSGGHLSVKLEDRGDSASLEVSDNGVGLSPELLPHIFERFRQGDGSVTRAHGGLGLGLAIVKHIVDAHGGSIVVESPGLNRGTTFRVRLPYS